MIFIFKLVIFMFQPLVLKGVCFLIYIAQAPLYVDVYIDL